MERKERRTVDEDINMRTTEGRRYHSIRRGEVGEGRRGGEDA
jgi:hypothetical protein